MKKPGATMKKLSSRKVYWLLPVVIIPLWLMNFFFDQRSAAEVRLSQPDATIANILGAQTSTERQEPLVLQMSFALSPSSVAAVEAAPSATLRVAWPAAVRQEKSALNMSFLLSEANAAEAAPSLSTVQAEKKVGARQAVERHGEMLLNVEKLSRQKLELPRGDPFVAKLPPPPPPAAALPPPPPPVPQAPALPFVFLGRMVENDSTVLFLSRQNQSYSVKLNGILERDYRVDKIDNDQVTFTYLPLNTQQILYIGRAG